MSVLPVPLGQGGEVGGDVVRRPRPRLGHQQPPHEETEQEDGGVGHHVVVGTLLGLAGGVTRLYSGRVGRDSHWPGQSGVWTAPASPQLSRRPPCALHLFKSSHHQHKPVNQKYQKLPYRTKKSPMCPPCACSSPCHKPAYHQHSTTPITSIQGVPKNGA